MGVFYRIAIFITCSALLAAQGSLAPIAAAGNAVLIGGGAAITVNGTACTLATIGTDHAGDIVGLTSAACGGPGAPVAAGWAPGTLGTVTTVDLDLDYAVITFDKTMVTPIHDFAGFTINGIGPDPGYGQWACRDSQRDGVVCNRISVAGADPDTVLFHACGDPADSGAPVTADDLLVGMVRGNFPTDLGRCPRWWSDGKAGFWEIPQRDKPEVTSINAIIGNLNTNGGLGAGFVPVRG